MSSRRFRTQTYAIALGLMALGLGLTLYKALGLGFPLLPGESRGVWTLESKVAFSPSSGAVDVSMTLPETGGGRDIVDEYFASSGLGLSGGDCDDSCARLH